MNRKYFVTGLVFLVTAAGFAQGVQMTYEHDEAKMKQITVMESGIGALTPDWYYNTLHENYSKGAASKNKTLFRTMAGINLYNQKDMAESIDSALVKRAAVEALNIADRSGGMLDIAWSAEGPKVSAKMSEFLVNIGKIQMTGGTQDEYDYWLQYYNVYTCAIRSTQDAYMPNALRKREYLKIYDDVMRKNELLVRYLVRLSNSKKVDELLQQAGQKLTNSKPDIVRAAMSRWKASGMRINTHPF
ncbi:DUF5045 domain-containing protein [uncultured Bacteroides sp.]|uniref:DUF5045 domain-containing protein n=1 Tax=uncultured Bacteroides sp. TaxID=162156 RepID=UPI002597AD83|nr:DUF5045 domain-containing protein [uncultured Bacteroides sp.]